uniref:Uncharacterized protein n=1 Tax=Anguilla anguilla TaxID=7936 RepID=A0A0E9S3J7_ANGAN
MDQPTLCCSQCFAYVWFVPHSPRCYKILYTTRIILAQLFVWLV